MPASKGKHLTKENREVIEFGIKNKDSARTIAKRIDVSPSTIVIITRREHRPFRGLRIGAHAVCVSRVSRSRNATSSRRAACAR